MKINQMTRVVIGLIVGIILGLIAKIANVGIFNFVAIFGTLYIKALKAIAPILVLLLVTNSLAHGKSDNKIQTKGILYVVIAYIVSSVLASAAAVVASYIWKVTIPGLEKAEALSEHLSFGASLSMLLSNIVTNPVEAVMTGNYLSILMWAVIFGIFFRVVSKETKLILDNLTDVISKTVQLIIKFAPLGVMGLIYSAVYENGISIFINYGKLILLLVGTMAFAALVINPIIVAILTRKNPYPLIFTCITKSGLNAFFTRSSAANIPINMELCEEMGLEEDIYSITIPLGSTINMDGAAVVITIMSMATAWTLGLDVPFGLAILMCIIGTLAAAGTAGTAGGSLMLIPLACSILNIPADVAWYTVGVGNQIGVIQDSVETMVNSSSDVAMTAAVDMAIHRKIRPIDKIVNAVKSMGEKKNTGKKKSSKRK